MAAGMAKGATKRGKRIAFGTGKKIMWDQNSHVIFRGNPNVAPPGHERSRDLEWIDFRKGHRLYNRHDKIHDRWIWNMDFRPIPGEMFFDSAELRWAEKLGSGFVLMEPNIEHWKSVAPNKQWPVERFDEVARTLAQNGLEVVQLTYGEGHRIPTAREVVSPSFRHALAAMQRASLYIGPEGGLHHGAAAVGIPGVVLFGGFIPPQVTGYPAHTNLTGGAEACGSIRPCLHCAEAMRRITIDEVLDASHARMKAAA